MFLAHFLEFKHRFKLTLAIHKNDGLVLTQCVFHVRSDQDSLTATGCGNSQNMLVRLMCFQSHSFLKFVISNKVFGRVRFPELKLFFIQVFFPV
ncbi:Uncharacterised protein [Mycobacteroides abscessus subsp. massiliense]|nr:Uncharacterised protein [Mycobacteroides abscessus subsp. massiliense]